jgi:hypothetical protein
MVMVGVGVVCYLVLWIQPYVRYAIDHGRGRGTERWLLVFGMGIIKKK